MEPPDRDRDQIFKELIEQFDPAGQDTAISEEQLEGEQESPLLALLAELRTLYDEVFSSDSSAWVGKRFDENGEFDEDYRSYLQNAEFFDSHFTDFAKQVIFRFEGMAVDVDAKVLLGVIYGIQLQAMCSSSPILTTLYSGGNESFAMAVAGRLSKMLIEGEI